MDYTGIALLLGLFAVNAFALNFLYDSKYKLVGAMNIIGLCLTVGLAFNFKQMEDIFKIFLGLFILVIIFFIIRIRLARKKVKRIEVHDEEKEEEL